MLTAVADARLRRRRAGAARVCRRISKATSSTPSGTARSRIMPARRAALRPAGARTQVPGSPAREILDVIAAHRARSRHRHPRAGIRWRTGSGSPAGRARVIACRSATAGRPTTRRVAAIDAGAHHATHLFNRMSSMTHRAPGVAGAVLESDAVAAEIICDGFHVHPSLVSMAIRVKGVDGHDGDHRRHRRWRACRSDRARGSAIRRSS